MTLPSQGHLTFNTLADFMTHQHEDTAWTTNNAERHRELRAILDDNIHIDLNEVGINGLSPLHIALLHQRMDCIELLVANNANPACEYLTPNSTKWETPLQWLSSQAAYTTSAVQHQMVSALRFGLLAREWPLQMLQIFSSGKLVYHSGIRDLNGAKIAQEIGSRDRLHERLIWIHVHSTNVRSFHYTQLLYSRSISLLTELECDYLGNKTSTHDISSLCILENLKADWIVYCRPDDRRGFNEILQRLASRLIYYNRGSATET